MCACPNIFVFAAALMPSFRHKAAKYIFVVGMVPADELVECPGLGQHAAV